MISIYNQKIRKIYSIAPKIAKAMKSIHAKIIFLLNYKSDVKALKKSIEEIFLQEKLPLFYEIEIETMNKCNGTCSFCAINKNLDKRPLVKMSKYNFCKIIDNLAELNFNGVVNYFSNNEPLLDNRIFEFISYGVSKLPQAYHKLYTNGTLLTEEKFQTLINTGLTYLRIDNYNDKLIMNSNIQKIYDKYKEQKFAMKCEIHLRYNNQVLNNRGGSAPNKPKIKRQNMAQCPLPFLQFIVRADCGVSLCCCDALGKVTFGNIKEQPIEEIWTDKKRLEILELMRGQRRKEIELCKECDFHGSGKDLDYIIKYPTGKY